MVQYIYDSNTTKDKEIGFYASYIRLGRHLYFSKVDDAMHYIYNLFI